MALALQEGIHVWQKVSKYLASASPGLSQPFRELKTFVATQLYNIPLQFILYEGKFTDDSAGYNTGLSEPHRVYAVWGKKTATAGDAYLVGYDSAAGGGGGGNGPSLGAAQRFVVLGASTVTNTGSTVLVGDLGLYAGTSVTGFPPGVVSGETHIADATAQAGQTSLTAAIIAANALVSTETFAPGVVIGTGGTRPSFTAGVYDWATAGQLTGAVTLTGSATDVFVFRMGSTFTTASASSVILAGGAIAANVFWIVGSSATLGTTTALIGNVLASVSITANTGATVQGRLLASTGAVTLDGNTGSLATAGGSGLSASADGRFSLPFLESQCQVGAIFLPGIPMVNNLILKSYTTFDGLTSAAVGDSPNGFVVVGPPWP